MTIASLYDIYLKHPQVQTDTRKLQPGQLYFALKGPNFNGNQFAQQAIDAGASYAVIDDKAFAGEKTILVPDVLDTLQQLALYHRRQFNIPFLAITGSNGKTTTKELIHTVLSSKYRTYTTQGNLNNHIGIPLTILSVRSDAQMAVIEMGANHRHEIESYCKVVLPTHGLITNVGKAHLEGFGGEEGVRKGKGELFDFLRASGGAAFVFQGQTHLQQMSSGIREVVTYGPEHADIEGQVLQTAPFLEVKMTRGVMGTINTRLVGSYNLPNILAAAAVGHYFKVTDDQIKRAIESYEPSNSRSQLLTKGTNKIILDAYNANPTSMKAAIENFAAIDGTNKILVLGAMAELGQDSIDEHKQIISEISKHAWQHVLLVGGDFAHIPHPFLQFADAAAAGTWIRQHQLNNSYVLVKGSRSMKMETVLDYI